MAPATAYTEVVIFVTELAKDISEKTKISPKETLARFQKGMIKGKRGNLKIIKDIYGGEALNALMNMQDEKESVIEVSKIFNLPKVEEKIKNLYDHVKISIDISDKSYSLQKTETTKPALKEKIIEALKNQLKKLKDEC